METKVCKAEARSKNELLFPQYFTLKSRDNKTTLTGPANSKKTTRNHAHLSLSAKSRKTNYPKSRKWPKSSIWAIFLGDFEAKYLEFAKFSEKQVSFKFKVIFSTNFSGQKRKKSLEPFLIKMSKCLILG